MSCGGLVAAVTALSIPWVVKDGFNGFLYSPQDGVHSLSGCLNTALKHSEQAKIRENARGAVQRFFSSEAVSCYLEKTYNLLVA
jgi:glycosyltransferase involved in cell wall biosynthesis